MLSGLPSRQQDSRSGGRDVKSSSTIRPPWLRKAQKVGGSASRVVEVERPPRSSHRSSATHVGRPSGLEPFLL